MAIPELSTDWRSALRDELDGALMTSLRSFLDAEEEAGRTVFPSRNDRFRALTLTPLADVRVVILGQDPYHGAGQAHGLAFSVPGGVKIPPSLRNIYKELESDLGLAPVSHGVLEHWARQGVLLLNSVMTVREGAAASHQGRGWEQFTDAVIRLVDAKPDPVVFMLWGAYAQKKAAFVDTNRHLVLTAPHPSPLSAYTGFFGCQHFSKANAFLESRGRGPIDWALPSCPEEV